MSYIIMRKPIFMEDEGRHFFVRRTTTEQEAREWVDAQADEYYQPHDYYITQEIQ